MEHIMAYIRPELLIVVIALWVLGKFLKLNPNFETEWQIPYILLLFGVVLCFMWIAIVLGEGFSAPVVIASIVQGVLVAGMAVFGNELIKQWTVKRP
jgi:hypothetical protein